MTEAYIVSATRTAGGRRNGRVSGWHPVDLGAAVLDEVVRHAVSRLYRKRWPLQLSAWPVSIDEMPHAVRPSLRAASAMSNWSAVVPSVTSGGRAAAAAASGVSPCTSTSWRCAASIRI